MNRRIETGRFMESALGPKAMRDGPEPGRARLLPSRVKVGSTAARQEPRPTDRPRLSGSGPFLSDLLRGLEPDVPRTWPSVARFMERTDPATPPMDTDGRASVGKRRFPLVHRCGSEAETAEAVFDLLEMEIERAELLEFARREVA